MSSSRRASRKRRWERLRRVIAIYRRELLAERGIPCSLCGHDLWAATHRPRLVRNYPSRLEGLRYCIGCKLWCEAPNGGGWVDGSTPAIAERFRNTTSEAFA